MLSSGVIFGGGAQTLSNDSIQKQNYYSKN